MFELGQCAIDRGQADKKLPYAQNEITIAAKNIQSGLTKEKKINVSRKLTLEEIKKWADSFKVNQSDKFKIHDKGFNSKVTFDYDEFGYYKYYESKKEERIIYVKATTKEDFSSLTAWRIKEDATLESVYLLPYYQNRKYADILSDVPGLDNNFEYRDTVKFVFIGYIPKDDVNKTWFISTSRPLNLKDASASNIIARIN